MRDTTWPGDDDDPEWWDDVEDDGGADSDDDDNDYVNCSECGYAVFADASICPRCGAALSVDTSPWSGRSTWWIWLGLLGIVMTILALLF